VTENAVMKRAVLCSAIAGVITASAHAGLAQVEMRICECGIEYGQQSAHVP